MSPLHDLIIHLRPYLGSSPMRKVTPVHGGHINKTYRLTAENGVSYLIKTNSSTAFPQMFADEAAGLRLLASTRTVNIPEQITHGHFQDLTYLLMEWIEPAAATKTTLSTHTNSTAPTSHTSAYRLLGQHLAALHRHTANQFGLDHHYHGWFTQSNRQHNDWASFFIEERLRPVLKLALEKGFVTTDDQEALEKLYEMTKLFGGLDNSFYEAYNHHYPLEPGWQDRVRLCHIYPFLILSTLGAGYIEQLRSAYRYFIR